MVRSLCNAVDAVAFVNKFRSDAAQIAKQLSVPVENILGLAAEESLYGRGRFAADYNNYFSLHAPAPLQTGSVPATRDPKVKVAVFTSFAQSGQSFAIKYGPAVKGIADPKAFGTALVRAGFNSSTVAGGGRVGFADYLAEIIGEVKFRMECK
jgi:flagellum-specific peptidoglycan hydrolase FlgJ